MARLTDEQKKANRIERKRAALEGKELKAVGGRGSLFAELAEPVTTEQAAWHLLRTKSMMVEHMHANIGPGMYAMKRLELVGVEAEAADRLGTETFAGLRTHCLNTYPSVDYYTGFWRRVLCSEERIVFGFRQVPDPTKTLGYRVEPSDVYQSQPLMTKAEFYARWPGTWTTARRPSCSTSATIAAST